MEIAGQRDENSAAFHIACSLIWAQAAEPGSNFAAVERQSFATGPRPGRCLRICRRSHSGCLASARKTRSESRICVLFSVRSSRTEGHIRRCIDCVPTSLT